MTGEHHTPGPVSMSPSVASGAQVVSGKADEGAGRVLLATEDSAAWRSPGAVPQDGGTSRQALDRPGEPREGSAEAAGARRTAAAGPGAAAGAPLGGLDLSGARAVQRTREFIRSIATGFPHVAEEAETLAVELVAHAVRHAAASEGTLRLLVSRAGRRLRIEVHDPDPVPSTFDRINLLDETGRGWFLVAAIADRHGIDMKPSGRSMWCELSAWPEAATAVN